MMIEPKKPSQRRAGAVIAILSGGGAAMIGAGRHLENIGAARQWPMIADISAAVLIVVSVLLLVYLGVTLRRSFEGR